MPNLFSFLPVAILAWVRASTSGLTRISDRARACAHLRSRTCDSAPRARVQRFDIDLADVGQREFDFAAVLPTPEKMMRLPRDAGGEGAAQLAFRDDIGAGAEPARASR